MNIYEKYEKLEMMSREIEEEKAELRESINKSIEKEDEPVQTKFGRFVKVVRTVWSYSDNFLKEKAKIEKEINLLKKQIKDNEKRAQILNKAESEEIVGFRFEINKE